MQWKRHAENHIESLLLHNRVSTSQLNPWSIPLTWYVKWKSKGGNVSVHVNGNTMPSMGIEKRHIWWVYKYVFTEFYVLAPLSWQHLPTSWQHHHPSWKHPDNIPIHTTFKIKPRHHLLKGSFWLCKHGRVTILCNNQWKSKVLWFSLTLAISILI